MLKTSSAICLNAITSAFCKEQSHFDQQEDKSTEGTELWGVSGYIFSGKGMEFQDTLWKCSKEISKAKATVPVLPPDRALPEIVAKY